MDGFSGVLLVGGASRRFGRPKALEPIEDETLAGRAWRLLGEVCDERLAVAKIADDLPLPFPVLDDGTDLRAPIAGLVAGIRAARYDICLVVPVDCPLLTPEALRELGRACLDVAVPPTGPLPGAYRKRALEVLERRLNAGELALRDALGELETAVVELDPALLANVNTPADLAALSPEPGS